MNISIILNKVKQKITTKIKYFLFQKYRIVKYKLISNNNIINGVPKYNCPVLIDGKGKVIFNGLVNLGVFSSPFFYNTYIYIEARNESSIVKIDSGVWINNNACIISDGPGIYIGRDTIIGYNFSVYDSDFHSISSLNRFDGGQKTGAVIVHNNVFIGSNVTILKGVIIGENTVIASGAIVSKSIPANVVAGGNPCRVIRSINYK